MKRCWILLAALAACRHELTPEEQRNIEGWVDAYLKADLRAHETMTHASNEHPMAIRERDVVEMKLVSASEDSVQGQGVRLAISSKAQELSRQEEQLTQEKNGLMVQGRALTDAEKKRLDQIDVDLRRVAGMKASLAQLAARVLPKSGENVPRPAPVKTGGY